MQLILNRRLTTDDGRGLDEVLDEQTCINSVCKGSIVHSRHWLMFGNKDQEKIANIYNSSEDDVNFDLSPID